LDKKTIILGLQSLFLHPQQMKTASIVLRSAVAVCFAFVMSSASCDLFDKVDDVTIEITLDHTFNVNETASATNVTYEKKETLDAAQLNSDFNKYKDKIKSISVSSVTYVITNCSDGAVVQNGKIAFSSINASSAQQITSLGNENLKAIEGVTKSLNYSQADLDALANLLKNDKKALIYLQATLAQTPVKFDVTVTVNASITADAL